MKRIIIAAASVAAILIVLSIIFGRLEPLLGLLGLGAISGNQIMSKAKEEGRKARAKERERLSKMSDQEVVDDSSDDYRDMVSRISDRTKHKSTNPFTKLGEQLRRARKSS